MSIEDQNAIDINLNCNFYAAKDYARKAPIFSEKDKIFYNSWIQKIEDFTKLLDDTWDNKQKEYKVDHVYKLPEDVLTETEKYIKEIFNELYENLLKTIQICIEKNKINPRIDNTITVEDCYIAFLMLVKSHLRIGYGFYKVEV